MADIRINALATTAASTASDDFVAVDGSANGTRKLNAFSPTFGGNLTVSGAATVTGTIRFDGQLLCGNAGGIQIRSAAGDANLVDVSGGRNLTMSGAATFGGNLTVSGGTITGGTSGLSLASGGTNQNITLTPSGTGSVSASGAGTSASTARGIFHAVNTSSQTYNAVFSGVSPNLTATQVTTIGVGVRADTNDSGYMGFRYEGSGSTNNRLVFGFYGNDQLMSLAATGNLLIGTTSDVGAKVYSKVADGVLSFGAAGTTKGIRFAHASTYSSIDGVDSSLSGSYQPLQINGSTVQIATNGGTVAASFDISQNAEFKGAVQITTNASSVSRKLVIFDSSSASNTQGIEFSNTTIGSSGSSAYIRAIRTSSSGSNTDLTFGTMLSGVVSEVLKLDSSQNATFAGNIKTAAPSGGTAATWRLGTVASVSPTSPNRTIEVEIGGTTYYIHAKTTNN